MIMLYQVIKSCFSHLNTCVLSVFNNIELEVCGNKIAVGYLLREMKPQLHFFIYFFHTNTTMLWCCHTAVTFWCCQICLRTKGIHVTLQDMTCMM